MKRCVFCYIQIKAKKKKKENKKKGDGSSSRVARSALRICGVCGVVSVGVSVGGVGGVVSATRRHKRATNQRPGDMCMRHWFRCAVEMMGSCEVLI